MAFGESEPTGTIWLASTIVNLAFFAIAVPGRQRLGKIPGLAQGEQSRIASRFEPDPEEGYRS